MQNTPFQVNGSNTLSRVRKLSMSEAGGAYHSLSLRELSQF
jgi:hypothetical protein